MALDQNTLTEFVTQFNAHVKGVPKLLTNDAMALFSSLAIIDLTFVYIYLLINEDTNQLLTMLFKKILIYGAFVFMIMSYGTIVTQISSSFAKAGIKAGGETVNVSQQLNELTNPSKIANKGIEITMPVLNNYISSNIGSIIIDGIVANLPVVAAALNVTGIQKITNNSAFILVAMLLASVIIIACFFILAMQLFVYQVEFAIVAALGIILIPFGVFNHTSFIFDKIKHSIINFGIKYMLIATLAGVAIKFMDTLKIPENPTWQQLFYVVLAASSIAYLAVNIPKEVDNSFR